MEKLITSEKRHSELIAISRSRTIETRLSQRAKIILHLNEGMTERGISKKKCQFLEIQ